MELENTAVETVETETDQEVVEPDASPEEGSNYQEVAEPESEEVVQSHEDNQRFQAMRHEIEDAQRERDEAIRQLEDMRLQQQAREDVYADFLDDEDDVDSILADALGVSTEAVRARIEERAEFERVKAENEQYRAEREAAEQAAREARENEELTNQLAEVQRFDPAIKSVLDFENKFAGMARTPQSYLDKGLTLAETYWALKAEQDAHKRTPPPEVGGVKSQETDEMDFSKETVMAMTPSERAKHWKEIRKAQTSGKW